MCAGHMTSISDNGIRKGKITREEVFAKLNGSMPKRVQTSARIFPDSISSGSGKKQMALLYEDDNNGSAR